MKTTATSKAVISLISALVLASPGVVAGDYDNVLQAILALTESTPSDHRDAVQYLAQHPEQSVPLLMLLVKNKGNGWGSACNVLNQSKDERVVPFYVNLLEDNYYAKEADGTRKQYGLGTKNGCIELPHFYGGVLASSLGELGDPLAIPTLKEAVIQGDAEVRTGAYKALYKLGAMSLDDLFDRAKEDSEANIPNVIQGIGSASIQADTHYALKVFERVIAELPQHEYTVASAHFLRVRCFTMLQEYDEALQECSEVMKFPQYENLVDQIVTKQEELMRLVDGNTAQEEAAHNQTLQDTAHKLTDPER